MVAVTRKPQEFPLSHERLTVAEADVHDRLATAEAIAGANAVLSALGVPFTRKPITIYSDGTASIAAAMERHGVLPDTENADVGGVHDTDGEPGNSGDVVSKVPG